jgi:hypothetical protein
MAWRGREIRAMALRSVAVTGSRRHNVALDANLRDKVWRFRLYSAVLNQT